MEIFKRRIINTLKYSFAGLSNCFKREEAFRVEVFLAIIFMPLSFYLTQNKIELILLNFSVLLILIVEILNTAIERLVDKFGKEINELSKNAKDLGSAAVFLSLMFFVFVWSLIIFF